MHDLEDRIRAAGGNPRERAPMQELKTQCDAIERPSVDDNEEKEHDELKKHAPEVHQEMVRKADDGEFEVSEILNSSKIASKFSEWHKERQTAIATTLPGD